MRCFVIRVGSSAFALPEDTTISIQDLLLQGIALTTSFKPEFYWKQDSNEDRSMHLEEIEVPELEAEVEDESEAVFGLAPPPVVPATTVESAELLLAELQAPRTGQDKSQFDDDIPF